MNIFVGNLSFSATDEDVKNVFAAFGVVTLVKIKRKSGQNSRGFGFVTMPDDLQAQAAISALNGKEFMGRPLSVTVKRPAPVKPKKDYKEIKRLRQEAKKQPLVPIDVPTIPEKKVPLKKHPQSEKEDTPRKEFRKDTMNSSQPTGSQAWEKRKGRGTSKPWKKKPGGVNKKFKHAR